MQKGVLSVGDVFSWTVGEDFTVQALLESNRPESSGKKLRTRAHIQIAVASGQGHWPVRRDGDWGPTGHYFSDFLVYFAL